ncbi:MAG: phospholipase D family protein [Planctomycetaceae bacterium]|nr:phospholipase D family protein [Planctomycetaceae bacterium]
MIRVDAGDELCELLTRAGQLADRGRLDVAVPFFDADSRLWRQLVSAAQSGSRVRLLTRPAADHLHAELFDALTRLGVRVIHLPRIHAKSVLLSDRTGRHPMGWVGSHNFTKASELTAQELGIVFRGRGLIEARLMQQALLQLDAWEHEAKSNRKLI